MRKPRADVRIYKKEEDMAIQTKVRWWDHMDEPVVFLEVGPGEISMTRTEWDALKDTVEGAFEEVKSPLTEGKRGPRLLTMDELSGPLSGDEV